MMKKALFFDIDGTLISGPLFPFREDREAMAEAAGKGHFLFLNTGRSFANIPAALLELPSLTGIAAGGGAHILFTAHFEPGNRRRAEAPRFPPGSGGFGTVYRRFIPRDFLEEAVSRALKQSRCCIFEGERDCYIINSSTEISAVKPPEIINSKEDFIRRSRGDFITKITIDGFVPEDERGFLETFLKLNVFPRYTEGIIRGENKAKAMEIILKNLGLRREDSVAIGDGVNDLDMIRFAGLGIAMGNACAELKAAAGAVTGDCGKGGVARALREFVL